ncbi:MAG: 3-oxoacyl-ACP synthase [Flavobacteriaceae bacterium]
MSIKEKLYKLCNEYVNQRLKNVQQTILSHQKALNSEIKSSAGDKHETGRAMLQLEMEKAGQQLVGIREMKETLAKIDVSKEAPVASLGTLIETNLGHYFLSISAGQLVVAGNSYFAISVSSPIGKLLLGKKAGERLSFNGKEIDIQKIS